MWKMLDHICFKLIATSVMADVIAGKTFSSDLRKLTAVSKSLSNFKIKYSVTEKII